MTKPPFKRAGREWVAGAGTRIAFVDPEASTESARVSSDSIDGALLDPQANADSACFALLVCGQPIRPDAPANPRRSCNRPAHLRVVHSLVVTLPVAVKSTEHHGRVQIESPDVANSTTGHGNLVHELLRDTLGRARGGAELDGFMSLGCYRRRALIRSFRRASGMAAWVLTSQ